ncbi:MAG: hypothetical protein PHD03_00525 [Bacilli bacterium]|nr:hypothetical protein [Bacilli bacterium]MDD4406735.1 hypothetical protein [Bacilli bacterium]
MKKLLSYISILAACFVGTLIVFAFASSFRSLANIRVDYLKSYIGELTTASTTVTGYVKPTQYTIGGAQIKAGLQMKSASGSYGSAINHTFTVNSSSTIYYSFWQGVTTGRDCKIIWKGNTTSAAVVGTWGAYS